LTEAAGPLQVALDTIRVFSVGTTPDLPRRSRRLDRGGEDRRVEAGDALRTQKDEQG